MTRRNIAAKARERMENAGRSNRIASSIIASMVNARVAGVALPLIAR
jgi:hypothetical protein